MEKHPKTRRNRKRILLLVLLCVPLLLAAAVLIHYRGVKPFLKLEYGSTPTAADFTAREATLDGDVEKLPCGRHVLNLRIGGVPTPVWVEVADTVAPTAEPVDQTVPLGASLRPDAFVRHVKDADIVKVTFRETPDFETEWDGTVEIVLSDGSGNKSTVPVRISVRAAVDSITVEAGSEPPTAEQFLLPGVDAVMDTQIDAETMRHVGVYPIDFTANSGAHARSELIVEDTVKPRARATMLQLAPGETAEPSDLVADAEDATDLTFAYAVAPDYDDRNVQTVVVRVTDEGGNTVDVESTLFISGVQPKVIEARREPLNEDDFEQRDGQTITMDEFIPDTPGAYAIETLVNGVPETFVVTVVDTTPPVLTQVMEDGAALYTHHIYAPEDFFSAEDLSNVTLSFSDGTEWDAAGERQIAVTARDAYGNEASATYQATFLEDLTPPRIYGAINRICYIDEPVAYFSEVFAEDDVDGRLEIAVESDVNIHTAGTYRVVYRTADQSGNTAEEECIFTLIERTVTEEELHELAQSIMAEITTPDMTRAEILRAIFDYVQQHIVYTNGVNNNYSDWRKAAFDGYTRGKGDCYNIYSLTRALLDETDIPYLSVERVKTYARRTRHYWVHVDLGTGWYCFDPTWTPKHRFNCFMWTKAQCDTCRLYWYYKEDEYPPLATEPFDYDAVVEMERQGLLP